MSRRSRWTSTLIASVLAATLSACAALTDGSSSASAPPTDLSYSLNPASYVYGTKITANKPASARDVFSYSVSPTLPVGLSMDPATGIITGTPTTIESSTARTITSSAVCAP